MGISEPFIRHICALWSFYKLVCNVFCPLLFRVMLPQCNERGCLWPCFVTFSRSTLFLGFFQCGATSEPKSDSSFIKIWIASNFSFESFSSAGRSPHVRVYQSVFRTVYNSPANAFKSFKHCAAFARFANSSTLKCLYTRATMVWK